MSDTTKNWKDWLEKEPMDTAFKSAARWGYAAATVRAETAERQLETRNRHFDEMMARASAAESALAEAKQEIDEWRTARNAVGDSYSACRQELGTTKAALAEALEREALLKARIRQFADDQENMSHTDIRVWCNEATVWTDSAMLLLALARETVGYFLDSTGCKTMRDMRQAAEAALADEELAHILKE